MSTARPIPDADDASAPFWQAAARHELVVQRCAACNAYRHPPRPACPSCASLEHRWVAASGRARIWSWIVAHPPVLPAFSQHAPYNVVVVELEEGVRMIGNLIDVATAEIHESMDVVVTFEDVEPGVSLPQWRRA
ncbi:MAG TPA: OB-fold domain-containing protein [Actinomycetota bacterium]|nr:OB-fold domain-containing protein [Actinomycetota bacterium]